VDAIVRKDEGVSHEAGARGSTGAAVGRSDGMGRRQWRRGGV
jgi:hypothetical protein